MTSIIRIGDEMHLAFIHCFIKQVFFYPAPFYSLNQTFIFKDDGTIDFGSYPQTKVTDEKLISSLTSLAGTIPTSSNIGTWTSYEYYISSSNTTDFMWYKDVTHIDDSVYRAVYFTEYRPAVTHSNGNSYQDDNGYNINKVYH